MENLFISQNNLVGDDIKDKKKAHGGLSGMLRRLDKSEREEIFSGYDMKSLAKIFEDGEMMRTLDAFLQNGMNVSKTARILYMHRNTLTYKLNLVRKRTGLDLRDFDMAVTFTILRALYEMR